MKHDIERELRQLEQVIEEWERDRGRDDDPDNSVPAALKPKSPQISGAAELPEPDEN
ncbi:MAG: hypothetical protein JOZ80_15805 [Acidobacteriaceae bacterium]|nr:hypothetical protein [Acidobacteriaceae bacterium]